MVEETIVAEASPVLVGEDGNFSENWMEVANVSEDLRADPTLKSTKNVAGLASQLVNAQKMIGQNTNTIALPTETSTEVEWDEFHKKMGRPDTADEYEITHLEGMGEIDAVTEKSFKELVHLEGLKPATVQKLIEFDDNRMLALRQAMTDGDTLKRTEANDKAKAKWGSACEEREHLANRMVEENTTEESKQAVLDIIGNDFVIADFLANIAKKFVEHKIISADVDKVTPVEALAKAEELRNTAGYVSGELSKTSPARYEQITAEIAALYKSAYPE